MEHRPEQRELEGDSHGYGAAAARAIAAGGTCFANGALCKRGCEKVKRKR